MFGHSTSGGWFFKKSDGDLEGPVPAHHLRKLLEAGVIRFGQAVWQEQGPSKVFVRVESVLEDGCPDPLPLASLGS